MRRLKPLSEVKRDNKTPNRKKNVFNTLTKCKIKYPSYKT